MRRQCAVKTTQTPKPVTKQHEMFGFIVRNRQPVTHKIKWQAIGRISAGYIKGQIDGVITAHADALGMPAVYAKHNLDPLCVHKVEQAPAAWLPWSYRETLAAAGFSAN